MVTEDEPAALSPEHVPWTLLPVKVHAGAAEMLSSNSSLATFPENLIPSIHIVYTVIYNFSIRGYDTLFWPLDTRRARGVQIFIHTK